MAYTAIVQLQKSGGCYSVLLADGGELPVSSTYLACIRTQLMRSAKVPSTLARS